MFRGKILQYLLLCGGGLATFQIGLNDGWPSFALPQLQSNTSIPQLTNEEGLWIATAFPIGITVGSLLLPFTIDVFGRKTMLLVGALPFCSTWMVIAFLQNVWELLIARFVAGLSESITHFCIPVYLAEIADPKIRGFLVTGTKISYTFGILLSNILGTFLGITQAALISSAMTLGVLVCLLVPESPYFYIIKNDYDKAKKCLELFNENADIDSIRDAVNEQKVNKGKWFELFTVASNRKSLGIIIIIKVFNQLSGGVSFVFYAQTLFKESLFLYITGSTLGLHNIPYLIITEIFPLHVKSWAITLVNIFYGISATSVSKFFQYTKDEFGLHLPFIVFTISSICSLPFFIFCVPETKKQSLEEIEKKLRSKSTSNIN
ncbi:hypothetical protein FQR65_LT07556 [Abscondita terminalis]|nr:hypothetical protein FQR65_LT07556 [Abscondita terminalis]